MRRAPRDPTSTGVVSAEAAALIELVVNTLTRAEQMVVVLRFGLLDGVPRSTYEVAAALRIHSGRVRSLQETALDKLRHPSRAGLVRHLLVGELSAAVLDRARAGSGEGVSELLFCARHGWVTRDVRVQICEVCPCRAGGYDDRGRPRRFCSAACRQAAYRDRRRSGAGTKAVSR